MAVGELPDPFQFANGGRVGSAADWRRRREELAALILAVEYGGLPPAPARATGELLHGHTIGRFMDARHERYRLSFEFERPFAMILDLLMPAGDGPFPAILTGDGCWRSPADEIIALVLKRGYALAQFDRVTIVPDNSRSERNSGLYATCPGGTYGALAAWAWGYHRCVDWLADLPRVDAGRIAVTGHSRGGKAALLAGATDERIALTTPNASGCGGAAPFRRPAPGSETMGDILGAFPYWFGPQLGSYVGREDELPFDQHCLKALVAPRALLCTESIDDLWTNPAGSRQTHLAAREVYEFLGAADRIGLCYRRGGHDHSLQDWLALLDFADWQFFGRRPPRGFDDNPFPGQPLAFSWRSPAARA